MAPSFIPAEPGWVALYVANDPQQPTAWYYPVVAWKMYDRFDVANTIGIVRSLERIMEEATHIFDDAVRFVGYFHPVRAPWDGDQALRDALIAYGHTPSQLAADLGEAR